MGRYCHDRTGAILKQNEVGHIDRYLLPVKRIYTIAAGKNTLFFRFDFDGLSLFFGKNFLQ